MDVIEGGKPAQGNFVCPYCADTFATRAGLGRHFLTNEECNRNRFVNNQTQSKYNVREDEEPSGE